MMNSRYSKGRIVSLLCGLFVPLIINLEIIADEPTEIIDLWPGNPPGHSPDVGVEADMTKPDDRLIAGRPIIKLGNVARPQLHVYLPSADRRNGSTVVVCPGGGFSILAWDLEGTEVAAWLNSLGTAAAVLKYRVPTRDHDPRWLAPVQDAQRAMSLVRSHAKTWSVAIDRVGMLGFSAGGAAAARTALGTSGRLYPRVDVTDDNPSRPDFVILVYPGALVSADSSALLPDVVPANDAPPFFLVHAADDRVPSENSTRLFLALREAGVPAELHVFETGGHGYGLRRQGDSPVTGWPELCAAWLRGRGLN